MNFNVFVKGFDCSKQSPIFCGIHIEVDLHVKFLFKAYACLMPIGCLSPFLLCTCQTVSRRKVCNLCNLSCNSVSRSIFLNLYLALEKFQDSVFFYQKIPRHTPDTFIYWLTPSCKIKQSLPLETWIFGIFCCTMLPQHFYNNELDSWEREVPQWWCRTGTFLKFSVRKMAENLKTHFLWAIFALYLSWRIWRKIPRSYFWK